MGSRLRRSEWLMARLWRVCCASRSNVGAYSGRLSLPASPTRAVALVSSRLGEVIAKFEGYSALYPRRHASDRRARARLPRLNSPSPRNVSTRATGETTARAEKRASALFSNCRRSSGRLSRAFLTRETGEGDVAPRGFVFTPSNLIVPGRHGLRAHSLRLRVGKRARARKRERLPFINFIFSSPLLIFSPGPVVNRETIQ